MSRYYTKLVRVSTLSQARKYGIELQSTAIERYAKQSNLPLKDEYIDMLSGTKESREAFSALLANADKYKGVIFYDLTRLARTEELAHKFLRLLIESGLEVHSTTRGIVDNNLNTAIDIAMSAEEWRKIRERTRAGMLEVAKKGLLPNGIHLFGYTNVIGKNAAKINHDEAEVIKLIFQLSSEGKSYRAIANHMMNAGIKTMTGKDNWYQHTVRRVIKNKSYMGEHSWAHKEQVFLLSIPAIVSPELWRKAQKRTRGAKASLGFPLTGHIKCGLCGFSLSARVARSKGKTYPYLRCNSHKEPAGKCDLPLLKRLEVENAVESKLRALLKSDKEMQALLTDSKEKKQDLTPEIILRQNEIGRIIDLGKRGIISLDEVENDVKKLRAEITNMKQPANYSFDLTQYKQAAKSMSFKDLLVFTDCTAIVYSKIEIALHINI